MVNKAEIAARNEADFRAGNYRRSDGNNFPKILYVSGIQAVATVTGSIDSAYEALREDLLATRGFEHIKDAALAFGYLKGYIQSHPNDPDLPQLKDPRIQELQEEIKRREAEDRIPRRAGQTDLAREAVEITQRRTKTSIFEAARRNWLALQEDPRRDEFLPRIESIMRQTQPEVQEDPDSIFPDNDSQLPPEEY